MYPRSTEAQMDPLRTLKGRMMDRAHHRIQVEQPSLTLRRASTSLLLWSTVSLYGILVAWLSVRRYNGYNIGMFDLGNMAQAIASVLRGAPLVFTSQDGNMSRLALHVELIYFLLAPFYALWPDPRLLLVIQAGLFALGAVPV